MRIVIDFGAIAHRIRCWWWQVTRQSAGDGQCIGCGKHLTPEEEHFYLWNSERCEGDAMSRSEGL